ncbi:MAG: YheC/YheD family protein [Bacillus sp. (in: Bacteria)]|nr:YheC/YheD family protein [Bacillus sp. (in: firmicutes)]
MISFGIMTLNLESENSYINEIASLAQPLGLEVFRFIPSEINPHTLTGIGRKYDYKAHSWSDSEFPIPKILYDRCFYGDDEQSKQCLPIVSWLKSRNDLTFLGYGLPNKLELYEILKNTVISAYLPKTLSVFDTNIVLSELSAMKKVILKPISGSQGYGIYYLKKNEKTYHVKTEKQRKNISRIFPNETKLVQWLKSLFSKRKYLLQPFLELSNNEQQPFDIRVLLQKSEQGTWGERGRGIRIGKTGGILSNLSAGGSVIPFTDWSSSLLPEKSEFIQQEIAYISSKLPPILEKAFLPLFELGIDIGIAKNGAIWILDINSKPGRKVLLHSQPDLVRTLHLAPLLYGKHLALKDQQERKNYYEKTLSH